jgi:hypothetical protein
MPCSCQDRLKSLKATRAFQETRAVEHSAPEYRLRLERFDALGALESFSRSLKVLA